jgi:hypothetical protein
VRRKQTVKEVILARMRAANGYRKPRPEPVYELGLEGVIERERREAAELAAEKAKEGDDVATDAE